MRKVFSILLISLFVSFSGCSSDDKDDPNEELYKTIELYKAEIATLEGQVIEMTKYCQDNEVSEGGYDKCYTGLIEPLKQKIENYKVRIEKIEKQLAQ